MNFADKISRVSERFGEKVALVAPLKLDRKGAYTYENYTFSQLEARINKFAGALKEAGVRRGDKALLFVGPCLDFSALTFALFKIGASPVFIHPGMERASFLEAIKSCAPRVLIGSPKIFLLKRIFPSWFDSVELEFFYSKQSSRSFLGALPLNKLAQDQPKIFASEAMEKNDLAAILFTSGSVGPAKRVAYTHDTLIQQTKALQEEFGLSEDDVAVPAFSLFSLFTLSMGVKTCIPDIDPKWPKKVAPKKLYKIMLDHRPSFVVGSPAILNSLGEYCAQEKLTLPGLKYMVMFGAPVSIALHDLFSSVLVEGDTYSLYGATESLPVSNAAGSLVLSEMKDKVLRGDGLYVGKALKRVRVRVIRPIEGVIDEADMAQDMDPLVVGEIIVSSPSTAHSYCDLADELKSPKFIDRDGTSWHRMGDMGYLDEEGGLWFCGRKAHALFHENKPYYSVQVEAIFNQHPLVRKSALIQKNGAPAIALERFDARTSLRKYECLSFLRELRELASQYEHTEGIGQYLLAKEFPVDMRYNLKIDRMKLAEMVDHGIEIG